MEHAQGYGLIILDNGQLDMFMPFTEDNDDQAKKKVAIICLGMKVFARREGHRAYLDSDFHLYKEISS